MSKKKFKTNYRILAAIMLAVSSLSAIAGETIQLLNDKSINIGMGIRTVFSVQEEVKSFKIEEALLFLSGQLNKTSKFTLNTKEIDGSIILLDAIIQYEPVKYLNFWMGRMLTPADRIEMSGPFYALSWNQYNVPLFPSDQGNKDKAGLRGRDNGATLWGTINKFQYAIGVFDGYNDLKTKDDNFLFAGRFSYNFLNMEINPGYYTSSTYYGNLGNIFTIAISGQQQTKGAGTTANPVNFKGAAIDFLFETKLGTGDVITLEGEYKIMDANASAGFVLFDGTSYFSTAAYMFRNKILNKGKLQPYVRYLNNETSSKVKSTLTEVGVNYIVSGHNLRININVANGDAKIGGGKNPESVTITSFGMQQQF